MAVSPHGGTLFVGTRSGVFRSVNGGAQWTAANGDLPLNEAAGGLWVNALAIDAGPPETVYASVLLQGVFKTVDGGATWQPVNNGLVGIQAEQLVAQAGHPGTVYALTSAGIFRTTNGGAQWTSLPHFPTTAPGNATVIAVDPTASQTVYAGLADQLLETVDGGQNWVRIDGPGFRGWYIDEIAVDPSAPNTLYVAAADFPTGAAGLFRSNDGGSTWVSVSSSLPSGKRAIALAIPPTTPGAVYVAPLGSGIFASVDGGEHWSALDDEVAHASALAFDPTTSDTLYAVGAAADVPAAISTGVFRTDDGGDSWDLRSKGIDAYELEAVVVDPKVPSTLYVRSLNQGILKSTDAGHSWQPINDGLGEPATGFGVLMLAIDPVDPRVLYASVYGKGYFKTVDAGLHWAPIPTPTGASLFGLSVLHVDPQDPRILITATGEGVFRSVDAGSTWVRASGEMGLLGQSGELFQFDLVREPSATNVVYAAAAQEIVGSPPRAEGALFKSVDRGATWSVVDKDFLYSLAIAPGPPSVLYAYAYNQILTSVDGGAHFTHTATTPEPIFRLLVDPRSTQSLFAATTTGVLRSEDGGASWRQWEEGLANVAVADLAFDPQNPARLYLATRGGGLSTRLSATDPCVPSETVLCLNQGRFRVAVNWKDFSGRTGVGRTRELTSDTGAFWFFTAENLELTVKLLDGRPLNDRFWVFYGALTNVEFTLEVTDTETGRQRVYRNPSGRFASAGDTDAF
ncbi:MAG TPA: hypothetical protein VFS60_19495 [Thermoanaerobaculia bacterium]|nr:hypothetical protein [Thermoanaerobaculia bacterium]